MNFSNKLSDPLENLVKSLERSLKATDLAQPAKSLTSNIDDDELDLIEDCSDDSKIEEAAKLRTTLGREISFARNFADDFKTKMQSDLAQVESRARIFSNGQNELVNRSNFPDLTGAFNRKSD